MRFCAYDVSTKWYDMFAYLTPHTHSNDPLLTDDVPDQCLLNIVPVIDVLREPDVGQMRVSNLNFRFGSLCR